jgi:1-acyl-sn-glycerol-3-phosphate acyltransferase
MRYLLGIPFRFFFWLCGWKIVGDMPTAPKWVGVVAPHTSNWDFFIMVAVKFVTGAEGVFVGKHTIFRWPVRGLLRRLGGIPVERSRNNHLVETLVAEFARRERMAFVSAPEGTRAYVPAFRTGFWAVATQAHVPVVLFGLDFKRKAVIVSEAFALSGDLATDLARIHAFFRPVTARYPALTFLNQPREGSQQAGSADAGPVAQ